MDEKSSYFGDRVKMLSRQKEMGVTVYPKFSVSMNLKKYRDKYRRLDNGKQMQEVQESLPGRTMSKQKFKNSTVYNLHGGGETIQIKAEAGNFGTVKHGDIVGVTGFQEKEIQGSSSFTPSSLKFCPLAFILCQTCQES